MEEEDNIIVKWAQEDVETLYNLLNKQMHKTYSLGYTAGIKFVTVLNVRS